MTSLCIQSFINKYFLFRTNFHSYTTLFIVQAEGGGRDSYSQILRREQKDGENTGISSVPTFLIICIHNCLSTISNSGLLQLEQSIRSRILQVYPGIEQMKTAGKKTQIRPELHSIKTCIIKSFTAERHCKSTMQSEKEKCNTTVDLFCFSKCFISNGG